MTSAYYTNRPVARSKSNNTKRFSYYKAIINNNYLKAKTEGIERANQFNVHSSKYDDDNRSKNKHFVQKSLFLPSIHTQPSIGTLLKLNSNNNECQKVVKVLDTESETFYALTECYLIIENLRKLTNSTQAKSTRRELNSYPSFRYKNSKIPKLERGGRSVTGTGPDAMIGSGGDEERFASYLMSKYDLLRGRSRISDKKYRVKRLSQNCGYSNYFEESIGNEKRMVEKYKYKGDRYRYDKKLLIDEEATQKKQRYMIKYLGRAKIGGCNLHEKIKYFKYRMRTYRQNVASITLKYDKTVLSKKGIQQKDEIVLKQR